MHDGLAVFFRYTAFKKQTNEASNDNAQRIDDGSEQFFGSSLKNFKKDSNLSLSLSLWLDCRKKNRHIMCPSSNMINVEGELMA
jgi:hypothetical protein